jgi:ankyrin repeat protein
MLPIHLAALNGYLDCVKKLLASSLEFEIDMADELSRTCLHAAACEG